MKRRIQWNFPVGSATSTSSFSGPLVLGVYAAVMDPSKIYINTQKKKKKKKKGFVRTNIPGFALNLTLGSSPLGPVALARKRDGETVTGAPDSDLLSKLVLMKKGEDKESILGMNSESGFFIGHCIVQSRTINGCSLR